MHEIEETHCWHFWKNVWKLISNSTNRPKIKVCTKPTCLGRCFNYNSNHLKTLKLNVIIGLMEHTFLLTASEYRNETLKKAENILLNNHFLLKLYNELTNKETVLF